MKLRLVKQNIEDKIDIVAITRPFRKRTSFLYKIGSFSFYVLMDRESLLKRALKIQYGNAKNKVLKTIEGAGKIKE